MYIFHLRKNFFISLIFLILLISSLQILYKITGQDPLSKISYLLFSEIQTVGVNLRFQVSDTIKKYLFLLNIQEENKQLKTQNKKLQTKQQIFEEILQENEKLKKLFQFPLGEKFKLLPAKVLATDFLSKNELITINKGSLHGVKKFMGVLHTDGVVGYIFRVSPHSSQVISLLSHLSTLPARDQKSRIKGLVEAYQKDLLIFNYLEKNSLGKELLKPGNKIVTVKTDQFPSGFLVGTVNHVVSSLEDSQPQVAYIKPSASLSSLEEVLVILMSHKALQTILPNKTNEEKDN